MIRGSIIMNNLLNNGDNYENDIRNALFSFLLKLEKRKL